MIQTERYIHLSHFWQPIYSGSEVIGFKCMICGEYRRANRWIT